MRKTASFVLLFLIFDCLYGQERLYDHVIFENSRMAGFYYFSDTYYQSPSWIKNKQQKLPVVDNPSFTPGNSLELNYVNGDKGYWKTIIHQPVFRGQNLIREGESLWLRLFIRSARTLKNELPSVKIGLKD